MTGAKATTAEADDAAAPAAPAQVRPPDRRTRRRERAREHIYATAIELFVEQGFDETTMDRIAERADVARATVFNHFSPKTAFLEEWTTRRRARAAQAVRDESLDGWSLASILRRYMTEMTRLSEEARDETVALMKATSRGINLLAYPALADELADFVREAQESGESPTTMSAHQAGVLAATAYFAVLTEWISSDPPPFDLQTELLSMLDNVLYGILSPDADAEHRRERGRA